jgi:hypothetical protein
MSLNLPRTSLALVSWILVCGSNLVTLTGCHHRPSGLDEVAPAGQATVADGLRGNDQRVRQFPGIDVVTTRNGGFYVRILSGLVGDGQPLYLIDDTPTQVSPSRGIDWFKPEDIVQIRVLKTPAETSVYGPLGVNGIVLITTRQGKGLRR